jgi:D-lactate dehydrogenase
MPATVFAAETDAEQAGRLAAALEAAGVDAELRGTPEPVRGLPAPAGLGPGVQVLSVFVGSRIGADLLAACPDLRLVATRSTGVDHVDLAACTAAGVAVANVPTYGENTVAEHTFALILALSRNVHKAWVRTQRGDFSLAGLQGFDLAAASSVWLGPGTSACTWPRSVAASAWRSSPPTPAPSRCWPR